MKTLFKLFLFLTLCFAALCQRNLGFQIDALGVAVHDNLDPYLKISQGESIYLMNLQSIYEIFLDPTTNQWTKDFTTETNLNSLKWNLTANLLKGSAALMGAPCSCENPVEPQEVEPFPVTRSVGRQIRDPFEDLVCPSINFDYLRFVFQNVAGENNTECAPADIGTCTTSCNEACAGTANPDNCNLGCSAITSASAIDTNLCNEACNITGAVDADCMSGCMNIANCIAQHSCRLDFGYHLHGYQWANATTEAPRKLVFSFEIVPETSVNISCGSEVVTWFEGPFLLWINTTTLAGQHQDGCAECPLDLAAAQMVASNWFYAPSEISVVGRIYVDQFETGLSIFNQPVEVMTASPQ